MVSVQAEVNWFAKIRILEVKFGNDPFVLFNVNFLLFFSISLVDHTYNDGLAIIILWARSLIAPTWSFLFGLVKTKSELLDQFLVI